MANMYTMPQPQYTYGVVPPPRQYSGHGTSSAFSSSANPDEDWTKISDLAERRRIQNRIAQRNYRKKLKRRLEDLERRAGTSDGSSGSEKQIQSPSTKSTKKSSPKSQKSTGAAPQKLPPPPPPPQFTPPMTSDDEFLMAPAYDERERSHTPPYMTYSAYPSPDEVLVPPYGSAAPYHPITSAEGYPAYMASTVPCTLPPLTHFSDAIKREAYPEESLSPYVNYGYVSGVEVNGHGHYEQHSNPHTPPLTHSFDHSANCSDAGYDYPTTPLSMPGSPGILQH